MQIINRLSKLVQKSWNRRIQKKVLGSFHLHTWCTELAAEYVEPIRKMFVKQLVLLPEWHLTLIYRFHNFHDEAWRHLSISRIHFQNGWEWSDFNEVNLTYSHCKLPETRYLKYVKAALPLLKRATIQWGNTGCIMKYNRISASRVLWSISVRRDH